MIRRGAEIIEACLVDASLPFNSSFTSEEVVVSKDDSESLIAFTQYWIAHWFGPFSMIVNGNCSACSSGGES
jgi:hypothetical protein